MDEDKLPISTLSDEQRQAAEFDGQGAKTLNDLTAELPSLRVGHNRFRCGRTLQESLGNDAYWHNSFSCSGSVFARVNLFGVWCAVEDLPGWTYQQIGSEFVVTDPNEGLTYHYQRPGGGTNTGDTPLKLASVMRSGSAIRTYTYSGGGVSGDLVCQTDSVGDTIAYGYSTQGSDSLLTVTGTQSGGGSRIITALYSSAGSLKSATWANGGPARQYEYIVDLVNPALDGRINRVLDAAGNLLLDYDYDSTGRVILTTRGIGPSLQTLNRQVYETPPTSSNQTVGDTWMISQCFVDATTYQATVRRFDNSNRVVELREYHDLQTVNVPAPFTGEPTLFTGPVSITITKYRGSGESLPTIAGITGSHFTIEKVFPDGLAAEYTVFDSNFNTIRTFTSIPGLTTVVSATLIHEKQMTHAQFAGVWQTTNEIDVARDNATTTMAYDSGSGFITSRTLPQVSAANSGTGVAIPRPVETLTYNPTNKKRIDTQTRNDGQNNTINITNAYDAFDYPTSRTEVGGCDTQVTGFTFNHFGQEIQRIDEDGYYTVKLFEKPGHPNNNSGLLLDQHIFASGGTGPVLQQTRYFYFTTGANQGRLEKIEIADHEGSFTLDAPAGWQVTTFAYDVYGRITSKTTTHTTKPGTHVWSYDHDLQDRIKQITYPDNMWVRTVRSGRGLTVNDLIGSGANPPILTNNYAYNSNGKLIDRLNQSAAHFPDHTTYSYDIFNRRNFKTDMDDGTVGYNIVTGYEYNASFDKVRETTREGVSGPFLEDIRRDFDEHGRIWRERVLKVPGTLDDNADLITTISFDVQGNEVGALVKDVAVGDAFTSRAFTCFDHQDTVTLTLNNSETAITDITTDRRGNVKVVIDPVLNRTEHDYDAVGQRTVTRHFERVGGADVLQLREDTIHTSRRQRARRTRLSASGVPLDQRRWEYDLLGFLSRHARMANSASSSAVNTSTDRVTDMAYDGVGRNLTTQSYDNGIARTTIRGHDSIGRLATVTHAVAGNSETLDYYANSTRLATRTITDEIGSRVMTMVLDPFGRLQSETAEAIAPALAVTNAFQYDAANRRTRVTDPLNAITVSTYDGIGQLASRVEDSGGADERTTTFTFTQKGDALTVIADDGEGPQTTTYQHDRAGRRTRITHPGGAFKQFGYDLSSRLQTRSAEDNFVTIYNHNWRGQIVQKRQTSTSGTILEEFSFDPLGRMTAAAVGAIATSQYKSTYFYGDGTDVDGDSVIDPAYVDQPIAETQTVSGLAKIIRRAYNTAGEIDRLAYPFDADVVLDYDYDKFGQVKSIDRNAAPLTNYIYAGRNVTSRQIRTAASAMETWIELVWSRPDQLRRPSAIVNQVRTGSTGGVGGTVTTSVSYTNLFDAASNLDQQTVAYLPIVFENGLHDHSYDRLHRLLGTDYPNTTFDESWQLDKLGNWESYTNRFNETTTYTDNNLNQYTAISSQTAAPLHDAKGNLVRNERGYGFTYDFENRLTRVFLDNAPENGAFDIGEAIYAVYIVDALGNRVQASIAAVGGALSTSYRYYDGSLVLTEYQATNPSSPSAIHVYGPTYLDEHILIGDGAGNESYFLLKDLYSVAGLMDQNGTIQQACRYSSYGLPAMVDFATTQCQPGDLDDDAVVDIGDLPQFIAVLLTGMGLPQELCASDLNGDGNWDGLDVQPLVDCLLNAGACPPTASRPSTENRFFFTGQRLDGFDPFVGPSGDPQASYLRLYDYKARVFDPTHGRFQQRDPADFTDAYNLYEYALSRPTVGTDPTGNEFTLVGISASTAIRAGLFAINAYGTLGTALETARALQSGAGLREVVLGIVIDVALDRVGGKFFDVALEQFGRLSRKFFKNISKLCCFAAGTMVETPAGPLPIESLKAGDLVITRDQHNPKGLLEVRPVLETFERTSEFILWITLDNGNVLGVTPGHLVWTNENGWVFAADLNCGESFLSWDGLLHTVVDVSHDETPTKTFNLDIAATGTYFANGLWVHNTSCAAKFKQDADILLSNNLGGAVDLTNPRNVELLDGLFQKGTYYVNATGSTILTNGTVSIRFTPGQSGPGGVVRAHIYKNGTTSGHGDNLDFPPGTSFDDILDVITAP